MSFLAILPKAPGEEAESSYSGPDQDSPKNTEHRSVNYLPLPL
jgi:hypothetical protein